MALPGATNSHGVQSSSQQAVLTALVGFYNHLSRNQKLAFVAAALAVAALFVAMGTQAGGVGILTGSQKNQAISADNTTTDSNGSPAGSINTATDNSTINIDSSSLDVKLNSQTTQSSDGSGSSSSSMSVNGQSVPTDSGNINKTIISSDGSTKINIKVKSSSSTSASGGGM